MPQYQSFPDITGSSKSLEKLQALRLPPLADKSFLDVGCNEGFFCGFAQYEGATHVVGIDNHQASIDQAISRFPGITFRRQSWDDPIEGQFDVILLASALHYAKDQEALIHKLVHQLTPTGTLVLELGMAPVPGNQWVTVKRSIDERQFPNLAKLSSILDPYAWKLIGESIEQVGDPTPRVVVHVQHRIPYAFLLMTPSGYGKSTISKLLGSAKNVTTISGDRLTRQVNDGKHDVSQTLRATVKKHYSPTNIAPIIERLFDNNLGREWVSLWLSQAEGRDVIVDAYIPKAYWDDVASIVREKGFAPIHLVWDMIGPNLPERNNYKDRTESYIEHLCQLRSQDVKEHQSTTARLINTLLNPKKMEKQFHYSANLPHDFNPEEYLRLHPDVAKAGMNPAYHYLNHGMKEGRKYR